MRPIVSEVISGDLDPRRKTRGQSALSTVLKFGNRIHKGPGDVERGHADVDIEYDPSEGGASG